MKKGVCEVDLGSAALVALLGGACMFATVDVIYDSGVAKISFDKLDNSWKRHFNYSPAKALAYQRRVARA